MRKTEQVS